MSALTCINDYLKIHGAALGHLVVEQFPPLHQPSDPVWPAIHELKRNPFPAQSLATEFGSVRTPHKGGPNGDLATRRGWRGEQSEDWAQVVAL